MSRGGSVVSEGASRTDKSPKIELTEIFTRRQCNRFALMNYAAFIQFSGLYRLLACVHLAVFFVVLWLSADRGAHRRFHAREEPGLEMSRHDRSGGRIHSHACAAGHRGKGEVGKTTHVCASADREAHSRSESSPQEEGNDDCAGCVVELMVQGQVELWFCDLAVGSTAKLVPRLDLGCGTQVKCWSMSGWIPFSCGPPKSLMGTSC